MQGSFRRVKEFVVRQALAVWAWFRMLTPSGRADLIEMARYRGRVEGARQVMQRIASMNRARRRQWVRNVVKHYKNNMPRQVDE